MQNAACVRETVARGFGIIGGGFAHFGGAADECQVLTEDRVLMVGVADISVGVAVSYRGSYFRGRRPYRAIGDGFLWCVVQAMRTRRTWLCSGPLLAMMPLPLSGGPPFQDVILPPAPSMTGMSATMSQRCMTGSSMTSA